MRHMIKTYFFIRYDEESPMYTAFFSNEEELEDWLKLTKNTIEIFDIKEVYIEEELV